MAADASASRIRATQSRWSRVGNRTNSANGVTGLSADPVGGSPADRVIGLPLEIVAENDLFETN
jgi:hypothetical protein